MNKQAVKIACLVYVPESYNNIIINRNNTDMLLK